MDKYYLGLLMIIIYVVYEALPMKYYEVLPMNSTLNGFVWSFSQGR